MIQLKGITRITSSTGTTSFNIMKPLTLEDLDQKIKSKIYIQQYSKDKPIEGVKLFNLSNNVDEEGDFSEILRIGNQGEVEAFPGFVLKQINRTKLYSHGVKAWHIHFKQDEVWYVIPDGSLMVGLWDIRKKSKTCGVTRRIVLGGSSSQLLYIPKGVAHGSVNYLQKEVEIYYFVNQHFNSQNPDEGRIPWDALGSQFWEPKRD